MKRFTTLCLNSNFDVLYQSNNGKKYGIRKTAVGDRVRVREDLKTDHWYGLIYFAPGMKKHCGQETIIETVNPRSYFLVNIAPWNFSDEMLEPATTSDASETIPSDSTPKPKNIKKIIRRAQKNGTPVKLENGEKVYLQPKIKQVTGGLGGPYEIYERTKNHTTRKWTLKGEYFANQHNSRDIIDAWTPPPIEQMPIDHPIYVRDCEVAPWKKKHFAGINPDKASRHRIKAFYNGKTSYTENVSANWVYYQYPTTAELIGTSWENSPFVRD